MLVWRGHDADVARRGSHSCQVGQEGLERKGREEEVGWAGSWKGVVGEGEVGRHDWPLPAEVRVGRR